MISRSSFTDEPFPSETVHALFEAVEIDDVIDPDVSLPEPIMLNCDQEQIRCCLTLCLQFWTDGVSRADLITLLDTLSETGDLDTPGRARYKHIRARYKHLRFALMLYGADHRVPLIFGLTVAVMGHLQDAFRNGRQKAVFGYVLALRALLAKPLWSTVRRQLRGIPLDTAQGFLNYRKGRIKALGRALGNSEFTGHQFHAMRKIVSQQVSFYDTLRSIHPDDHSYRMSRFLSAINGLMGGRHDELVEQAVTGVHRYGAARPLSDDIRRRLELLVEAYPN